LLKHKFLLLIFIIVVLLFVTSGYLLYASLTSEDGDPYIPFLDREETTTTVQETTPAVTEPITTVPEDPMYFISFYCGTQWLYTDAVKYGEMPKYVGKTPEKEPDEQYIYSFDGWSEKITPATQSKSYTAVFSKIERSVSITFKDSQDNVLEVKTVSYGSSVTSDKLPNSYRDERFEYTPIGWTLTNGLSECVDLTSVKSDMVLYPAFKITRHSSLVTFQNTDGTVLQEGFVEIGKKPSYNGETPTRQSDGKYNYKFEGWSHNFTPVNDVDIVYTALYSSEICIYTVTFCNSKTKTQIEIKVTYGGKAEYPEQIPDINFGAYVYKFAFWAVSETLAEPVDLSCITQDITVYAYYTRVIGE